MLQDGRICQYVRLPAVNTWSQDSRNNVSYCCVQYGTEGAYRCKNSRTWIQCYVVWVASSGNVWCFFLFIFYVSPRGSFLAFAPFLQQGILGHTAHSSIIRIFTARLPYGRRMHLTRNKETIPSMVPLSARFGTFLVCFVFNLLFPDLVLSTWQIFPRVTAGDSSPAVSLDFRLKVRRNVWIILF